MLVGESVRSGVSDCLITRLAYKSVTAGVSDCLITRLAYESVVTQ